MSSMEIVKLGSEIATELLVVRACACRHFYVSIDDGKYLEKCVLCDEPKCV